MRDERPGYPCGDVRTRRLYSNSRCRIDNGNIGDDVRWMRMPDGIFEDWEGHGRRFQLDLDYDF